jgi:hypothetical protein
MSVAELRGWESLPRIARALERVADALEREHTPAVRVLQEVSASDLVPMHLRADADQALGEVYGVRSPD